MSNGNSSDSIDASFGEFLNFWSLLVAIFVGGVTSWVGCQQVTIMDKQAGIEERQLKLQENFNREQEIREKLAKTPRLQLIYDQEVYDEGLRVVTFTNPSEVSVNITGIDLIFDQGESLKRLSQYWPYSELVGGCADVGGSSPKVIYVCPRWKSKTQLVFEANRMILVKPNESVSIGVKIESSDIKGYSLWVSGSLRIRHDSQEFEAIRGLNLICTEATPITMSPEKDGQFNQIAGEEIEEPPLLSPASPAPAAPPASVPQQLIRPIYIMPRRFRR